MATEKQMAANRINLLKGGVNSGGKPRFAELRNQVLQVITGQPLE